MLVADDHPIIREKIRSAIGRESNGIEVIGEASNGEEVLKFPKSNLVDVYILDIVMPKLNGIETCIKLLKLNPKNKIIILTIHDNKSLVKKALCSGIKGYVLKEDAIHDLNQAIQKVHLGHFFFSPSISEIIVDGFMSYLSYIRETDGSSSLSQKEGKILRLVVDGNSDEDIASNLNLPLSEVKTLRKNINNKLGGQTQPDLVRIAIEEDIL